MLGVSRYGWTVRQVAALCALVAMAVWAGWTQWVDIFTIAWRDEEASHILLVPPIIAWLVWVRRVRFRRSPPRLSWIGPVLILAGWLLAYFSFRNAFQAGWHGGAVLMLVGAVATVVGVQVLANFAPAVILTVMLIPVPAPLRLRRVYAVLGPRSLPNSRQWRSNMMLSIWGRASQIFLRLILLSVPRKRRLTPTSTNMHAAQDKYGWLMRWRRPMLPSLGVNLTLCKKS